MAHRALRNGKRRACGLAGAGERVGVVVESAERGVVQPGVLDEFELPGQVGRQAEEIKPGSGSPLERTKQAFSTRCCGLAVSCDQDLVATPVKWRPLSGVSCPDAVPGYLCASSWPFHWR